MERNTNLSLSVEDTNSVNEEESEAQPYRDTATTEDNEVPTIVYPSEIMLETTATESKEEEKSDKDDSEEEGSDEEITVIDDIETQIDHDDNTSLDPKPQDN